MYVDAAHCYRPSSVVCLSVIQYLSVTLVSPGKTTEPIEIVSVENLGGTMY